MFFILTSTAASAAFGFSSTKVLGPLLSHTSSVHPSFLAYDIGSRYSKLNMVLLGRSFNKAVTVKLSLLFMRTTLPMGSSSPYNFFASCCVMAMELILLRHVFALPFNTGKENMLRNEVSTKLP